MTKISHHLSDAILMAHATAALPEAFGVLVATHIGLCDTCRAAAETYDTLGGAVLERGAAPALAAGSLDATFARIDATPFDPRPTSDPRHATGPTTGTAAIFPAPLRDWVGGDLDAVKWRALGGGVRHARIKTHGIANLRLLHIPAGTAVPDHGHRGIELTLVLDGAFRDGDNRFARGDVETADAALHHHPVAEAGADCICLAATDAPLKFKGILQKIAQPFLGI